MQVMDFKVSRSLCGYSFALIENGCKPRSFRKVMIQEVVNSIKPPCDKSTQGAARGIDIAATNRISHDLRTVSENMLRESHDSQIPR